MKIFFNKKIVIIGAGPAGCSCAIALLNAGAINVTLITNSKTGKFHIGESIPPEMNSLMRRLGIYDSFIAQNHEQCYGSCSYWGSERRGYNDSVLSPFGHGWHLDRRKFNQFMLQQAIKRGAKVIQNCNYKSATKNKSKYQLTLNGNSGYSEQIEAEFVIDATGSKSVFTSDQGSRKIQNTSLVCLGLRFQNGSEDSVSKLTHLEAVEHGWWYAARIPNNQLLVTFYTIPEITKEYELHNIEKWKDYLKKAVNTYKWVSNMKSIDDKIMGFHAPSFIQDHIVGENWFAIGDSATCYDPITSQGIIKSVSHGMLAARVLEDYYKGDKTTLIHYENHLQSEYKQYEEARTYFYSLEQRWPKSLFWKYMHNLKMNIQV
ncbi:tryptophan 7-halogenase [Mariniflexile sp. AS56]|uniref:tryptophan 7-halogenase n=1 Tax=Mariniflexile sp. AS56 TaxID=3063957 RepID=UPI0026F2C6FD|nr:tryptophan 7-halogenase [Mariniflexile sp. AS56]MDO7172666.1 tryptophan 7-halogenase [Mariniflexile sp. AS56]